MKRSAQIGLLVMGTLSTTAAAGYMSSNHDRGCQERALNNPQGTQPQDCRRSVWYGSGHGYGGSRPIYGATPSGAVAATSAPGSAPAVGGGSVQRGGFGGFASSIAHAFSGS